MAETKFTWWLSGVVFGIMASLIGFYVWIHHEPEKVRVGDMPENITEFTEATKHHASTANNA